MNVKNFLFKLTSFFLLLALVVAAFPASSVAAPLAPTPLASSLYLPVVKNDYVLLNLGRLIYTLDTSRKVSGKYDNMSSSGFYLAVVDAKGYIWELSIPVGALLETQTITMTPFATLDTSQSLTTVRSGVQLEPDGLQFSNSVLLMVTPPISNPGIGLIFTARQDGSHLGFASTKNLGKKAIATIWHFSSDAYDDGYDAGQDGVDQYRKMAEEDYKAALGAAKLFIKYGLPTPPIPPAISQYCRGTEINPEQNEAYEYMRAFVDPYGEIVKTLLDTMHTLQLLGDPMDISDGWYYAQQILQIAEKAVLKLGATYETEKPPDRLYALITTGLQIDYQLALLVAGESINPKLTEWSNTLVAYYLNRLKTNHDYRAFPRLLTLAREAQLLGAPDRLGDIMNAMTFEVTLDTKFDAKWDHGGGNSDEGGHVEQQADVKGLQHQIGGPSDAWGSIDDLLLHDTAGNYTVHIYSTTTFYTLDPHQTFNSTLYLMNWDACVTKSFDVDVTTFGGGETYTSSDGKTRISSVPDRGALLSFKDIWFSTGWLFSLPMQNLSATLGDKTFTGSGTFNQDTGSAQVHFVIKHTPQ